MGVIVLGIGARGTLVTLLQRSLIKGGYDPGSPDGTYGTNTSRAVRAHQTAQSLPATGEADPTTWTAITGQPVPELQERCLQLTANFEGHGYGLAQGNFDGAGITWGIIGFTLASGEVQGLLQDALKLYPDIVTASFGPDLPELRILLNRPKEEQLAWADQHSIGPHKVTLIEPWKTHFRDLGNAPEIQDLQLARVTHDYYTPALETASSFDLTSELGIALCFDCHVQNGGISATLRAQIRGTTELERRVSIANAVANHARPAYQNDVRSRKLAIATGTGTVHGQPYTLRNWGLDETTVVDEPSALARTGGGA